MVEPSEFAEACAERVSEGWTQGMYVDANDNVCALGAISQIQGQNQGIGIQRLVESKLSLLLFETTGHPGIPHWNDDPSRTQQDVVDAFIAVAKDFRNEGR